MKLYTRRGDDGGTELFGGQRTSKHTLRIETVGSVDELNSALGLAAAACGTANTAERACDPKPGAWDIREVLSAVQSQLFEIGADLATPLKPDEVEALRAEGSDDSTTSTGASSGQIPRTAADLAAQLEARIDEVSDQLTPLGYFILPGGCELAARLHAARTTCRRAERRAAELAEHQTLSPGILPYLNRLGDLLFALARLANHQHGVEDVPWRNRGM